MKQRNEAEKVGTKVGREQKYEAEKEKRLGKEGESTERKIVERVIDGG